MIKKIVFLMTAVCLLSAHSALTYFTFTGAIDEVSDDEGGYAAAHGVKAGNYVSYVFAVDTARKAYSIADGQKTELNDSTSTVIDYQVDFFFDSLVTAPIFSTAAAKDSGSFVGMRVKTAFGG